MDARPPILKARLFPLKGRLTLREIEDALHVLARIGCVELYEVDTKPYLSIPSWGVHQQIRAKRSKYPPPKAEENRPAFLSEAATNVGNQLIADDCNCPRNPIQSENNPYPNPNPNPNRPADALAGFHGELRERMEEWLRYKEERGEKYQPMGLQSFISQVRTKSKAYTDMEISGLIGQCMANGWKGIIWDKLERVKPKQCLSAQTAGSSLNCDAIDAIIDGQFDKTSPGTPLESD